VEKDVEMTVEIGEVSVDRADLLAQDAVVARSKALALIRFIESKTGPGKTALATSPMKHLKEGLVDIYSTLSGALVAGGWLHLNEDAMEDKADGVRPCS
jgi:hypothetical protein